MDFAHIYGHRLIAGRRESWLQVVDNHVPVVVFVFVIKDQPDFKDVFLLQVSQMLRQPDPDAFQSMSAGQIHHAVFNLVDPGVFPVGRPVAFAFMGELGLGVTLFAQCAGGLAGFVEGLLSGIAAVGVKRAVLSQIVFKFLCGRLG